MSPGAVAGNGQVGRRFLSTPVESGRIQYPRDAGIVDRGILILMIKKNPFFFLCPWLIRFLCCARDKENSGWKPTHPTSVFALQTSISPPDGTTLTALIQMLNADVRLVGFHPPQRKTFSTKHFFSNIYEKCFASFVR